MVKAFNLPGFTSTRQDPDDVESLQNDIELESICYESLSLYIPKHERCFAHSLQLVIKHALEKSTDIVEPLKKVHNLAALIRKSTALSDSLEDEKRAQLANCTRWNSQLIMVRSIIEIDKIKLDSMPGVDEKSMLTLQERGILSEFMEIMSGFEEATNRVQGIRSFIS